MEKLNIAEILKDCPTGMELDCTMFDDVYFDYIDDVNNIIKCYIQNSIHKTGISFNKYGCYLNLSKSKCVIFPKGKSTWEGFQRPFKDGDVVFYDDMIAIFKEWGDETLFRTHCVSYTIVNNPTSQFEISRPLFGKGIRRAARFATEEERQKLFDTIKENGYEWNPCTKTLDKLIVPKFKVGDRIKSKINQITYTITAIRSDVYIVHMGTDEFGYHVPFSMEKNYELVPNKFDITTLKSFESKVLVRIFNNDIWKPAIWGTYNNNSYITTYGVTQQCIPYENNKHLLGTTNDCDEYYKTWE